MPNSGRRVLKRHRTPEQMESVIALLLDGRTKEQAIAAYHAARARDN